MHAAFVYKKARMHEGRRPYGHSGLRVLDPKLGIGSRTACRYGVLITLNASIRGRIHAHDGRPDRASGCKKGGGPFGTLRPSVPDRTSCEIRSEKVLRH